MKLFMMLLIIVCSFSINAHKNNYLDVKNKTKNNDDALNQVQIYLNLTLKIKDNYNSLYIFPSLYNNIIYTYFNCFKLINKKEDQGEIKKIPRDSWLKIGKLLAYRNRLSEHKIKDNYF